MKAHARIRAALVSLILVLTAGAAVKGQTPQAPVSSSDPNKSADKPANPPAADEQDPRYRLAVNVELVNVTATVLDEAGKYVDGLKAADFQVLENGQPQKVSFFSHDLHVPISVGLLVDLSGSMRHKLQQALQTVREIASALSSQDEMFLISFASDVEIRNHFTNKVQDIQKSLRDMKAGGETACYDAISEALQEMKTAKHDKKIIIIVTDGFDTRSRINEAQTEELLKHSETLVYAIGIDDDENDPYVLRTDKYHIYHYMLNRITSISGGRAFRMFTGRSYALQGIAESLLDELHQQYTLGYYPSSREPGWRQIEVKVDRPGSQIRSRTGYYISSASNGR